LHASLYGSGSQPTTIRPPGLDLARGAALVPAEQSRPVRDAVNEAGATFDLMSVWRET
jgi:hypothetical protein